MATIEKRETSNGKVTYRVKIRMHGFPPETATFESKRDAEKWARKVEADMQAGRHFGETKRHTFAELVAEFESRAIRKSRLDYWREAFGDDRLDTITPSRIAKERDRLAAGTTRNKDSDGKPLSRSGATVNRYLAALSTCLSYGVKELQWLERNPMERVQKPAENKGRVRFLTEDERPRLLEACKATPELYLAVVMSLTTGARQEEIMALRWPQVDLSRQIITLHNTKNGDRRALPLVGEALDLLKARAKVRSISDDRIFPPSDRSRNAEYLNLRRPWEQALQTAKIDDFHWHDLRHTAASYMAMSGISLVEIAKVLGHRTLAMVARYAHLSDGHIIATGQKLANALNLGGKQA